MITASVFRIMPAFGFLKDLIFFNFLVYVCVCIQVHMHISCIYDAEVRGQLLVVSCMDHEDLTIMSAVHHLLTILPALDCFLT